MKSSQISAEAILRPFRRVTSSTSFIPQVDGIRCLAILFVIVFHLRNHLYTKALTTFVPAMEDDWAAKAAIYGYFGVPLFFALSGFILALPFAAARFSGKPFGLGRYFTRRLTRLEPPYLLIMLLLFLLLIVVNKESGSKLLPHLFASLAYLHSAIYATNSPINLVTWSLEVEIQFYLLMPLLALVYLLRGKILRRSIMAMLMIGFLVLQLVWFAHNTRFALSVLNFVQFFLAGMILADCYLLEWKSPSQRGALWDVAGLCGWLSLFLVLPNDSLSRCLSPFVVLLIFASIFRGTWSSMVFSNRWITTIGGMCYTIYLLHLKVISLVGRYSLRFSVTHSFAVNLAIQLALILPCILIVSAMVFLVLEKPCMRPSWPVELRCWLAGAFLPRQREPARVSPRKSEI